MSKIRVIVVDDSPLQRLVISDILEKDSNIDVIATAKDGMEAFEKCRELKPDVITVDMEMPKYNGTWLIKRLMSECPIKVLIVSSLGNTNIQTILDALKIGAIDYISKPEKSKTSDIRDIGRDLISKVKATYRSNLNEKFIKVNTNTNAHTFANDLPYEIIAVGSSTGGPGALESFISNLPGNLPLPIVIAQHMPANFVPSFVKRINSITPLDVFVGKEGMEISAGQVAVLNGEYNSVVLRRGNGRVTLGRSEESFRHFNNPSIDCLFNSVANRFKGKSIGVILTGMGRDGGDGLLKMKNSGSFTIGQDESSCVVYGMPKYAFEIGAVTHQVPLKQIGGFLVSSIS